GSLAVVEPGVSPDDASLRLAAGADDVLSAIVRYESLTAAVAPFPVVIATSSMRGRGRARLLELADLPAYLAQARGGTATAFVFGPEQSGLTEDELARASACLRLPTQPAFPTMNLSHAVAVVLATARAFASAPAAPAPEPLAPAEDVEAAIAHWDQALEA